MPRANRFLHSRESPVPRGQSSLQVPLEPAVVEMPPVFGLPPMADAPPVPTLPPLALAPPLPTFPPLADAPPVPTPPPLADAPPVLTLPPVAGVPPVLTPLLEVPRVVLAFPPGEMVAGIESTVSSAQAKTERARTVAVRSREYPRGSTRRKFMTMSLRFDLVSIASGRARPERARNLKSMRISLRIRQKHA